jgi:hypothetical protein
MTKMALTLKEWAMKELTERGLSDSQAEAVIEQYAKGDAGKEMERRWDDCTDGYEEQTLHVLCACLTGEALYWIEDNCPKHWAKPMFMAPQDREAYLASTKEASQ